METLKNSNSRQLYSWWWDSHISPKNSKWLQENLTDMDKKVKCMIKLIEEDADSLSMRAEMFYEKRPELMKLVEEFYRAYRALAERYDHSMIELQQAHKTMEETIGLPPIDDEKQIRAEIENQNLIDYNKQCVEKISDLEKKLSLSLEESNSLEKMLSEVNQDIERLNDIVLVESQKLNTLTEQNLRLEAENQSLRSKADDLTKKILIKDQEIFNKHEDLMRTETLTTELNNVLQMLKDFDYWKPEKELDVETIPHAIRYLHNENSRLSRNCDVINEEKQVLFEENALLKEEKLNLEKRFNELEEKEIKISTGSQLAILERNINILREENRWTKKEFDEELDRALNAQIEIFILQKFVHDMKEKNYTLLKMKSDVEFGLLDQQVEVEILSEEIRKMRLSMCKVFEAMELDYDEQLFPQVLERINDLKFFMKNFEDDYHQLLIENSHLKNYREENLELSRTIDKLRMDHDKESKMIKENLEDQIRELLEICCNQKRVIKSLKETAMNEVKTWESDLSALYSDLQASSVLQVVYQTKVYELVEACQTLVSVSGSKTMKIEEIKERAGFMKSEMGDLRLQLSTLERNHMKLLEHIVFFQMDPSVDNNRESQDSRDSTSQHDNESVITKAVDMVVTKNILKLEEDSPLDDTASSTDLLIEKEMNMENIEQPQYNLLERLSSDCEKLANLKMRTLGLLIKLAISERNSNTRRKMKKMKGFDFEAVKEQLTEVVDAAAQLECLNSQMKRKLEEEIPSSSNETETKDDNFQIIRVSDMALKASENISELEMEFAKMQFVVMKLEEEEDERKGNIRAVSFQNRKRDTHRKKKPFLSGCFFPDSNPQLRIGM